MLPLPATAPHLAGLCAVLLGLSVLCGAAAQAACSRAITVPVAPTGFNVQVNGELVQGVYPDLLRALGETAGCRFSFPIYPRARVTMMFFDTQEADVFIPASRTAERDAKAQFVPMLKLTPTLISLRARALTVTDVRGLLGRSTLRAAVVRSYSWGDEYDALMRQLEAEKRVDYVTDLRTVGLMLRSGRVDFTILPPTLMHSALQDPAAPAEPLGDLAYRALDGLSRSEVGAYLSPQALARADLDLLRDLLQRAARDGSLLRSLERYYPVDVLKADVVLQ
nr:transporter substrate-binding domain-containing protein [uncultured Roseateles sp.]